MLRIGGEEVMCIRTYFNYVPVDIGEVKPAVSSYSEQKTSVRLNGENTTSQTNQIHRKKR